MCQDFSHFCFGHLVKKNSSILALEIDEKWSQIQHKHKIETNTPFFLEMKLFGNCKQKMVTINSKHTKNTFIYF